MLSRVAKIMSSFFIRHEIITEDDRAVYDYSFEVLISTVLNLGMILIISIAFNSLLYTCCFLISFSLIRANAGGYHANTHWGCILTLGLVYAVYMLIFRLSTIHILQYLIPLLCITETLLIFILAPVEDPHKKLSKGETVKFRNRSIVITIILEVCILVLTIGLKEYEYSFSIAFGVFSVALSLLLGKRQRKRGDENEENC